MDKYFFSIVDELIVCRPFVSGSQYLPDAGHSIKTGKKFYSYAVRSVRPGGFEMGIAWLWYFTNSADADRLRMQNEQRAATVYSLWRATHRRLEDLTDWLRHEAWDERQRARSARYELRDLSDHLLQDIGLLREGVDEFVAEPRRANRTPPISRSTADATPAVDSCGRMATLPTQRIPRDEAIDARSRAA